MEQPNAVADCLKALIEGYRQSYHQARDQWPEVEYQQDWHSPCLADAELSGALAEGDAVAWQLAEREVSDKFSHVEEAMAIELPQSAKVYWNSFFSANVTIDSEFGIIELLQPWNEEDYLRFQQNLVGHLLTQQRFKLPPTVFIGVIYDGEQVVGVDQQGQVWLEVPGRKKRQLLAESLVDFLSEAKPIILPE